MRSRKRSSWCRRAPSRARSWRRCMPDRTRRREAVDAAEDALKVDRRRTRRPTGSSGSVLAALADQRQAAHPGDDVSLPMRKRAIAALEIARGDGTGDLVDRPVARRGCISMRTGPPTPSRCCGASCWSSRSMPKARCCSPKPRRRRAPPTPPPARCRSFSTSSRSSSAGACSWPRLYERQHRWEQAADAWAAVQQLNPRNAEVLARRATALMNADHAADARDMASETRSKSRPTTCACPSSWRRRSATPAISKAPRRPRGAARRAPRRRPDHVPARADAGSAGPISGDRRLPEAGGRESRAAGTKGRDRSPCCWAARGLRSSSCTATTRRSPPSRTASRSRRTMRCGRCC